MDINDFFQENRKLIFVFGVIYIIVIIVIIIYIWAPKEKTTNLKDITKYEIVDDEAIQSKILSTYIDKIALQFMLEQKQEIEENISEDYIDYTKISKEKLIEELTKQGYFSFDTHINDITQYKLEDIYVYRGKLNNGTHSRNINIIETYPYQYTISFDDIYKYSEKVVTSKIEGIKFEILQSLNNINYVEYKIRITNIDNDNIKINLNNENSILIELNNGASTTVSYPKIGEEDYMDLSKGSSIVRTLMFRVPLQSQESIEKIVFKDVDMGQTEQDIELGM